MHSMLDYVNIRAFELLDNNYRNGGESNEEGSKKKFWHLY